MGNVYHKPEIENFDGGNPTPRSSTALALVVVFILFVMYGNWVLDGSSGGGCGNIV